MLKILINRCFWARKLIFGHFLSHFCPFSFIIFLDLKYLSVRWLHRSIHHRLESKALTAHTQLLFAWIYTEKTGNQPFKICSEQSNVHRTNHRTFSLWLLLVRPLLGGHFGELEVAYFTLYTSLFNYKLKKLLTWNATTYCVKQTSVNATWVRKIA